MATTKYYTLNGEIIGDDPIDRGSRRPGGSPRRMLVLLVITLLFAGFTTCVVVACVENHYELQGRLQNQILDRLTHTLTRQDVASLKKKGVDINCRHYNGETPLMYCAVLNNVEAARALVAEGARVDMRDNDGRTAADLARYFRSRSVLEFLSQVQSER